MGKELVPCPKPWIFDINKINKITVVSVVICGIYLSIFSPLFAGGGTVDLSIEGDTLSVNLKAIPLKDILEKLEKEKGIWCRGDESVLGERISVQFTGLSLEGGMKRILASMNYSLLFDKESRLIGVIVVGKSGSAGQGKERKTFADRLTHTSKNSEGRAAGGSDFKVVQDFPPSGKSRTMSIETKIVKNSLPPENPNAKPIDTKIVKNSPPPEKTNVPPIDMTVIKNCPPPKNPNAEPIDTKIIKNCPAPGR